MLSSQLLFALCETIGDDNSFFTFSEKNVDDEAGSIASTLQAMGYFHASGSLRVGIHYLLSEIPLYDIIPDVIFSNEKDGGKTSMFGYAIDDYQD